MNKIFKPFIALFKLIYRFIDKIIVTPVSRLIYKVNEFSKENAGRFEKILNRPNVLIYVSLICAIAMFLLVDSQVINLTEKSAEIITDQNISVLYNEEKYVVEGVPESVDITLIGSSSSIYLATQLGDHNVTLDLSGYSAGTYKVKLKYNHSVQSVDYKLDPSTVTVKISEKVSESRNLSYDLMNENKLSNKLSVAGVKLDTSEVVIKSSRDILDKVATVKALIDASQITLTESGDFALENVQLVAYDQNGNRLSNVETVPSKVTATITIDSYNATKPVKIVTEGQMKDGFAISNINSSISEVTIYGDKETVDAINYVEAKVDVDKLDSDKTVSVNITRPNGIRYMSESKTNVTISVDKETQRVVDGIEIHAINVGSDYVAQAASVDARTVSVILKGVSSVINEDISDSDIYAYVDCSNLTEVNKVYSLPVVVKIDDERIIAQPVKTEINVKISKK